MIVSALYILLVTVQVPGSTIPVSAEVGRYTKAACLDQANLGNHIGERGIVYRCIPAGPFQTLDRPTR